jgi:hypothetical protein
MSSHGRRDQRTKRCWAGSLPPFFGTRFLALALYYLNYTLLFTCPNSEWTQRQVEYSESETLMAILQDWVLGEQKHQKALYCLLCNLLPQFLIGWELWSLHSPPTTTKSPRFPTGNLKPASRRKVSLWHVLSGTYSFYPLPHSIMIYPSQFKFPYQSPLPQHLQADTQQAAGVKCLAWRWTTTDYF